MNELLFEIVWNSVKDVIDFINVQYIFVYMGQTQTGHHLIRAEEPGT
jgi:hypothetical protein